MTLEPETITCTDCSREFEFTQEEAEFFNSKGFTNYPKRCPGCRAIRREANAERQTYPIVCEECGKEAQVLHPDMKLCRECYKQSQQSEG